MTKFRCLWVAVIAAVMASAAGPSGADNPSPPQKSTRPASTSQFIEVVYAFYGHGGMRSSCVVTPVVKRSCNGRSRCVVNVDDDLCPPPSVLPAGLILTLNVEFKCTPSATVRNIRGDKPFPIVIDCGGAAGRFSPAVGPVP